MAKYKASCANNYGEKFGEEEVMFFVETLSVTYFHNDYKNDNADKNDNLRE